jgi:hypothetical protein
MKPLIYLHVYLHVLFAAKELSYSVTWRNLITCRIVNLAITIDDIDYVEADCRKTNYTFFLFLRICCFFLFFKRRQQVAAAFFVHIELLTMTKSRKKQKSKVELDDNHLFS